MLDNQQTASHFEAISDGAAVTLSSPDSDVSLDVPRNAVNGTVVARVYGNSQRFRHLIPAQECLLSPIVIFEPKSSTAASAFKNNQHFTAEIPHTVVETNIHNKIKVRYGDVHKSGQLLKTAGKKDQNKSQDVSYEVHASHITVYSRFLTGFLVTVPGSACCSRQASIRIYGSLKNDQVGVKTFLCNYLYSTKDYQKVCLRIFATISFFKF